MLLQPAVVAILEKLSMYSGRFSLNKKLLQILLSTFKTHPVKAATLTRPFKIPVRIAPVRNVKQKQHRLST